MKPELIPSPVSHKERPSTLNPMPTDPKPLRRDQASRIERHLHRQVMKTIRETFGRD